MTTGRDLDLLLSKGYFRMQQQLFTCQFILFNEQVHTVHWLRIVLAKVQLGKRQQQLMRRNERFQVRVKPFVLTPELKALYARYYDSLDFDAPTSVEDCLFGTANPATNVFNTRLIEVRDGARLIAAGIFDVGRWSIAGIMNFYDPDYRRHSLGKYLMLLKITYAQQQRLAYYYPGYVVKNYPKFDYKLDAAESATELLDTTTDEWKPFSWETMNALSEELMREE